MSSENKDNKKDKDVSDIYHKGERSLHSRVGLSEQIGETGKRAVTDYMSAPHQQFFSKLSMLFVGGADELGDLWSSMLIGEAGFIQNINTSTIMINAQFNSLDPLFNQISKGSDLGLLGLHFNARRRNRVNVKVLETDNSKILLTVKQCYGNCPKYIQRREASYEEISAPESSEPFDMINDDLNDFLLSVDSLFIASQHLEEGEDHNSRGVDVSHRGGMPGFLQIPDNKTILIPDYIGNNFFNTLGNITLNPKIGLQFLDFDNGHRILMTGEAEVIWEEDEALPFNGVDRMIRFRLKHGYMLKNVFPFSWRFESYSPFSRAYQPDFYHEK